MTNKVLFYLLHGESCKDRVNNVLSTWGKNNKIVFCSDYIDPSNQIYKLTEKKSYEDLEEKHVNGFLFLKTNFTEYEWYFFCDDDTFVNTKKLDDFISNSDINTVYGCLLNTWPVMPSLFYPSGGAGVLIHKSVLDKIINVIEVKGTGFADVTLGLHLSEQNINTLNSEYFHSEPPNFYGIEDEDVKNNITFHHIKNFDEMNKLNNLCK